jgi:hypothetical protein
MPRTLPVMLCLLAATLVPGRASAALIGTLELLSPVPQAYVIGVDFVPMTGSGVGSVTAIVGSVDLLIPPSALPNSSTSGCEASDFAGFIPGSVALLQRGTCTFELKAANAAAAGALAVIIFNEGQPGRTDVFSGSLGSFSPGIPVIGTSYAVGAELNSFPGAIVRVVVTESPVPEPMLLALVGLGGGATWLRRRRPPARDREA